MKHTILLKVRPGLTGLLVILSLITTACYSSVAAQNPASATPGAGGEVVMVAENSEFGQILVTSDGKALYTNTVDKPDNLLCTNIACTSFWLPYTVDAEPSAVEGIQGTLGTVTRPDGSLQLTFNQMPVYTFYQDTQPGEVKGEGFEDLGGTWHVVVLGSPSGGNSSAPGGIQY